MSPKWIKLTVLTLASLVGIFVSSLTAIIWLSYAEFRKVEPELISFLRDAHSAVNTTSNTVNTAIKTTSDNLNRDCSEGKERCGTLADLNQTLHTIRGTAGQVEFALKKFNGHEDEYYKQETALFGHANGILDQFGSTVGTINKTVDNFNPLLTSLNGEALEFKKTNYTLNDYLTGKDFKDFLNNVYGITANANSVSTDIATKTHTFLYPPPCKGKGCWLKRTYTVVRDVGPFAQPFYYGAATYEALTRGYIR